MFLKLISIICVCLIKIVVSNEDYFAPSVFLNHGGGPLPVLREKYNVEIGESLKNVSQYVDLKRLKAVVVVTAHREEDIVIVSSGERHSLIYDYHNYPPESYKFKHDAPGHPTLARKIHEAFKNAGIQSALDDKRGWDHGVFIPMMLINPEADIPIVQVSILKNQDALQHYLIGKVLFQFRQEGVAILGSGLSYHNMNEFNIAEHEILLESFEKKVVNEEFDQFLNDVCTGDEDNLKRIVAWDREVGALESHPPGKADHLMPLIVNAGAAGPHRGKNIFDSIFYYKFKLSGFMWDLEK